MTHTIEIRNHSYTPQELKVVVGDAVKWVNRDGTRHSATRDSAPKFDTGLLAKDQESLPISFLEASPVEGYEYYCNPHPDMLGKIIVTIPV